MDPEETARALGASIRDARRSARMTQAELAARAGLAERTLRDIERGAGTPGLPTVIRVAATVGLTIEARAVSLEERLEARLPRR